MSDSKDFVSCLMSECSACEVDATAMNHRLGAVECPGADHEVVCKSNFVTAHG